MEVISIERSTYEELLTSFNNFVTKMKEMASRGNDKRLGNWQPNSFTNPPQFAYPCIIAAPYQGALNPRLAFYLRSFCVNLRKLLVCYNIFS